MKNLWYSLVLRDWLEECSYDLQKNLKKKKNRKYKLVKQEKTSPQEVKNYRCRHAFRVVKRKSNPKLSKTHKKWTQGLYG